MVNWILLTFAAMASPEDTTSPSTSMTGDEADMNMIPSTMDNSIWGKLSEGREYVNLAGEEFQKCYTRLEEAQIESIRQTHIRLVAIGIVGFGLGCRLTTLFTD